MKANKIVSSSQPNLLPFYNMRGRKLIKTVQAAAPKMNSTMRPDDKIWEGVTTKSGRQVNTGDGVDREEAIALVQFLGNQPKKFWQLMREDSLNGTPVVVRLSEPFFSGMLNVNLKAENGVIEMDFSLVEGKRGAGVQSNATIDASGSLEQLSAAAQQWGYPAISMEERLNTRDCVYTLAAIMNDSQKTPAQREDAIRDWATKNLKLVSKEAYARFVQRVQDKQVRTIAIEAGGGKSLRVQIGGGKFHIETEEHQSGIRVSGKTVGSAETPEGDVVIGNHSYKTGEKLAVEFEDDLSRGKVYTYLPDGTKKDTGMTFESLIQFFSDRIQKPNLEIV